MIKPKIVSGAPAAMDEYAMLERINILQRALLEHGISVDDKSLDADNYQKLSFINPAVWVGCPAPLRNWFIDNWVPAEGEVTGVYGDGGIGKSFMLQWLQYASALGVDWYGLQTERVASIGIYTEDNEAELWRRTERLIDYQISKGLTEEYVRKAITKSRISCRLGMDSALITFSRNGKAELTRFYHDLVAEACDIGAKLAVLDNVSTMYVGNPNDPYQTRSFVDLACRGIAVAIKGAVMAAAHPSRSAMTTGDGGGYSVQWNAAFRSRISVEIPKGRDGAPMKGRVTFSRKKGNYADANAENTVELKWAGGVLVEMYPEATPRPSAKDTFLTLLDLLNSQQRYVSPKSKASTYAPKTFAQHPDSQKVSRERFETAMEELFRDNVIEVAEVKTIERKPIMAIVRKG